MGSWAIDTAPPSGAEGVLRSSPPASAIQVTNTPGEVLTDAVAVANTGSNSIRGWFPENSIDSPTGSSRETASVGTTSHASSTTSPDAIHLAGPYLVVDGETWEPDGHGRFVSLDRGVATVMDEKGLLFLHSEMGCWGPFTLLPQSDS